MALVHERLYQSSKLSEIDFKGYIEQLATELFNTYCIERNSISLNLEVEELSLGIDQAVPCGLILNELISNALKHAFNDTDKGEIKVKASLDNDYYKIEVSDNGKGLSSKVDIGNPNSLGMELVKTLSQQLNSQLDFTNNDGTTVTLRFKGRKQQNNRRIQNGKNKHISM